MPINRKATPPTKVTREGLGILDHLSAWTEEPDSTKWRRKGYQPLPSSEAGAEIGVRLRWWLDPDSTSWCIFVGLTIIANAVVIGLEMELGREQFLPFEHCFITIFLLELVLRMRNTAVLDFWKDPWNVFDFIVVLVGVLDLWVGPIVCWIFDGGDDIVKGIGYKASLFRLLRMVRIVRLLRLFRVVHPLYLVLLALKKALGIVMFISFFVILMDFVLAICLTQGIGYNAHLWGEDKDRIEWYFGSIALTMHTLFLIMTLSGWEDIAEVLQKVYPPAAIYVFFVAYLLVSSYTMLSLITSIMSDSLVVAQQDNRRRRLNATQNMAKDLEIALRVYFHELHDDEKDKFGNIPPEHLKLSVRGDPEIVTRLAEINIVMDEKGILDLIDKMTDDGKKNANIDYFVNKLVNLHGQATASSVVDLKYELDMTQRKLAILSRRLGIKEDVSQAAAPSRNAGAKPATNAVAKSYV